MATLLLVDDDPQMGTIVGLLSRRAGHRSSQALDTTSAWGKLVADPPPDLLLLDVNLGGECGLDLCRRLRAEPRFMSLPVALFSQWSMTDDIAAGLDAGVDFLLAKDLVAQPAKWAERLREILGDRDSQDAAGLVGSSQDGEPTLGFPAWLERVNQTVSNVLPVPAVTVQTALFRRVLAQLSRQETTTGRCDLGRWVTLDAGRLVPHRPLPAGAFPFRSALLLGLMEQCGRLLGREGLQRFTVLGSRLMTALPREQGVNQSLPCDDAGD